MVSASGGLIRKDDHQGDALRRLLYTDLLAQQERLSETGETFVRYMPNGRLPETQREVEIPEIPPEEIQRRRMEVLERELYQKVYAEAEQAGLEIGEQKKQQEINRILPQLEGTLRELSGLPERIFAAAERFLVETAITLTRQLLAHELSVHPEKIVHRIQRILKHAAGRRLIVLRVARSVYEIIKDCKELNGLVIEPDDAIKPGSVVMDSDFGGIEDLIEEQLCEIEIQIRNFLQERLDSGPHADIADAAAERTLRSLGQERPPLAVQGMLAMEEAARTTINRNQDGETDQSSRGSWEFNPEDGEDSTDETADSTLDDEGQIP